MKAKILSEYLIVLSLFSLAFFNSCEKGFDQYSEPAPKIVDTTPPTITLITAASFTAHQGDSIDISFTAKDDKGLYFVKVENTPNSWKFAKTKSFANPPKEYVFSVRVGVPSTAAYQVYNLVLGTIDVGYNDAKVLVPVTIVL